MMSELTLSHEIPSGLRGHPKSAFRLTALNSVVWALSRVMTRDLDLWIK